MHQLITGVNLIDCPTTFHSLFVPFCIAPCGQWRNIHHKKVYLQFHGANVTKVKAEEISKENLFVTLARSVHETTIVSQMFLCTESKWQPLSTYKCVIGEEWAWMLVFICVASVLLILFVWEKHVRVNEY